MDAKGRDENAQTKAKRPVPSAEEFVRVWQTSKSVIEVAEKTGIDIRGARQRATLYRKKGVPLQRFSGGRHPVPDWEALKALAEELGPK